MENDEQRAARCKAVDTLVDALQKLTPDSTVCMTAVIWQTEDTMVRVATSMHPDMVYKHNGVEMNNVAHFAMLLEDAAKRLRETLG